jgi:hypothetical protein
MQAPERPTTGDMAMNYIEGFGVLLMNFIGPAILALILAYGGYQTYLWRRRRGKPVDARATTTRLPASTSSLSACRCSRRSCSSQS